jgi:hypothetical protein
VKKRISKKALGSPYRNGAFRWKPACDVGGAAKGGNIMHDGQSATRAVAVGHADLREYLGLLEAKKLLHRIAVEGDPNDDLGARDAESNVP